MATSASRARALSLYRALLRAARRWPGPAVEQKYIFDESRSCFKTNQSLRDPKEIAEKLEDGQIRLEYAWHYKIPYPRLENFATGTIAESSHNKVVRPLYEVPAIDEDK